MASKRTKFHAMYFPQYLDASAFSPAPFKEKKYIVLINSAKRIDDWKKDIILKLMYGWKVTEINPVRHSAIDYFGRHSSLDLYGSGWDSAGSAKLPQSVIDRVYGGILPFQDKFKTIRNYRFSLCFENSIFPGYVTEKIFDSLLAGCVPVYYGAPDIEHFVPKGTFVDFRDFKDFRELDDFLRSMDETTYNRYLENIRSFLPSPAYYRFTQEYFTKEILNILETEFANG